MKNVSHSDHNSSGIQTTGCGTHRIHCIVVHGLKIGEHRVLHIAPDELGSWTDGTHDWTYAVATTLLRYG